MDITGWDTVVFTCRPPRGVFRRILTSVLSRWPEALVLDAPQDGPLPADAFLGERLVSREAHLVFLRDSAMAQHMDRAAFAPMADGDGPFAVIVRARREVEFRIDRLEEMQVAGEPEFPKVEPYSAWLCSPSVFEITIVTPDDPVSQSFSVWACEIVRHACRETD